MIKCLHYNAARLVRLKKRLREVNIIMAKLQVKLDKSK